MYDTYIRSLLSLDGRQTSSLNMKLEGIEQDLPLIAESTSHFPVNHVTNCTCVSQPLVIVCSRLAHCFHFITLLPASRRCSDTLFFFFLHQSAYTASKHPVDYYPWDAHWRIHPHELPDGRTREARGCGNEWLLGGCTEGDGICLKIQWLLALPTV